MADRQYDEFLHGRADTAAHLTLHGLYPFKKQPAPPFKTQQGPDEQAIIVLAGTVFVKYTVHVRRVQIFIEARFGVTQEAIDILNALAPKPGGIRGAKPLLHTGEH